MEPTPEQCEQDVLNMDSSSLLGWAQQQRSGHPRQEVRYSEQARLIAKWYGMRWQIEVMHRLWKIGCRVEQRRFREAQAMQVMIVLDLIRPCSCSAC
jgi:hypothetical protein